MQTDPNEILRTAQFIFSDLKADECIELRTFGNQPRVAFAARADEFTQLAEQGNHTSSVYFGVNPRKGSLYNRAGGRWTHASKGNCGSGADVTRRRYIFFDFDPIRPKEFKGFNATDAECATCQQASIDILCGPILGGVCAAAISGNGVQAFALVDLPTDSSTEAAVKRFYKDVQREHKRPGVEIDSVGDLPRFAKVPGTVHRDKKSTADRPIRLSKWIYIPELMVVALKLSERITAAPSQASESRPVKNSTDTTTDKCPDEWFVDGDIPERFTEALENKKIRARWDGCTDGLKDTSGSGMDQSLATLLAMRGFEPNEIYCVLRKYPHGSKNGASKNPRRHYGRIIQKAMSSAKELDSPSQKVRLEHFNNLAVLGVDEYGKAVVFSRDRQQLHAIDLPRAKDVDLLRIVGEEFRELSQGKKAVVDGEELKCIGTDELLNEIALTARETFLPALQKIGVGVWPLGDDVLLVGDNVFKVSGQCVTKLELPVIGSYFVQVGSKKLKATRVAELLGKCDPSQSRQALLAVFRTINQWRFKKTGTSLLLTGLIAATLIQAVWGWRPLVWLTGKTDAGKSLFVKLFCALMGGSALGFEGKLSEAGLRQTMQHDSVPVVLDEFEENPHRERILELLRFSGRGGTVVKGTPGHNAVEFRIQHLIWAASIDVGLTRAADQNRWIVVELELLGKQIVLPGDAEAAEMGLHLFAAMLASAGRARELERQLRTISVAGVSGHVRDSFVVPAAAIGAMLGFTDDRAEQLLRCWLKRFGVADVVERESDEDALLNAILSSQVAVTRGEIGNRRERHDCTVGQVLGEQELWPELERFGIKVEGNRAFFAGTIIARELLGDTRLGKMNVNSILRRHDAAREANSQSGARPRVAGSQPRGVWLPLALLVPPSPLTPPQSPALPPRPSVGTAHGTPKLRTDMGLDSLCQNANCSNH